MGGNDMAVNTDSIVSNLYSTYSTQSKTGKTNKVNYTWEIKDNVINFTSEVLGSSSTIGYKISQENDTLTRVDGQEGTYTRKSEDVPAVADTVESSNQEPDTGIYTAQELATKKSDDYVGAVVSNYSPKNRCNVGLEKKQRPVDTCIS